ncbi:2-hydroxyacid dehydrogenase [Marinomonas sp.]
MPIAILLVSSDAQFREDIKTQFSIKHPDVEVYLPGDEGAEKAELAACWHPPASLLNDYPNLKLLHALSAGVDHLGKNLLDSALPVCRIVDPNQKHGMFEYILWGILNFQRDFEVYRKQQCRQHWQTFEQRSAAQTRVTLLGLGEIGAYVAQQLALLGYHVNGWSRTHKNLPNVSCFSGQDSLDSILRNTDILVNLLPLTSATQGILSRNLFAKLPKGSYLVNCGRGGHVQVNDLIMAVAEEQLKGALLDVFDEEPLPLNDPLWTTPNIIITPHIASSSSIATIVNQVVENMNLYENQQPLKNQI